MLVFPALLRSLCPAFHYTLEDSTFSFEGRARAPQSWQRHWSGPQKGVSWHFLLPGEAGEAAGIGVNCLSWSQHRPHLCTSLLQLLGRDPEELGAIGHAVNISPFPESPRSESAPWGGGEQRQQQPGNFPSMCAKESPLCQQEDSASNLQASPL